MKCVCSPDGVKWLCSQENDSPQIISEKTQTCSPNETFMRHCNFCKCDSTGSTARCTEKDCYQNSRMKRSDDGNSCNVGSLWKDGCSPCECMEGGIVSCIFKDCITGANVGYRFGTNYGYINDGSSDLSRDLNVNDENIPYISESDLNNPNFRCHPRKPMKLDCNTCWCNSKGDGIQTCTRIACRPTSYAPLDQQ